MSTLKRIMVADANPRFLEVASEVLESEEVEALIVESGERVPVLIEAEHPDAALLNIELPEVSGEELCKRIKLQHPTLPVVLMFCDTDDEAEAARRARQVGADNYLLRPMREKELRFVVRAMLRLGMLAADQRAAEALTGDEPGEISSMVSLEVFHRFLELEIRRSDRYGFPLAVLSMALDPLPSDIPQAWASSLEKQLAEALSQTIRSTVRAIDISAALSMKEVLALMPHTDAEGAAAAGERIREAVANQPYHFGRTRIQPTISVGVGLVHGDRVPGAQLLSAAQSRRLQATHSGGNKVLC
jgi:diguanylate cyclase (GGDEF)-like protein